MEQESGGILDSLTNYGADALRAVNQGLLMGYGDEAMAGIGAGYEALTSDASFGDAYDRRLGRERSRLKEFKQGNPIAAMGAEVVGALPTAILAPGGAMMNAARPLAARMGAGAASGAAYGGAYGFGQGEGGPAGRVESMGAPAAIGGAIGAAGPVVARGAGKLAELIAAKRQAKQAGTKTPEASQIMQEFVSADMAGAGERLARAGPKAMTADVGPNTRQLLDVAIQTSGPAGTAARQAINKRVEESSQAIRQTLDATFGAPKGVKVAEGELRAASSGKVRAAYRDAYSRPIDYATDVGEEIERVISKPVMKPAIREANKLIQLADEPASKQIKVTFDAQDNPIFETLPDVRQLDYIARGLSQVAEREAGKGAMGRQTTTGRAYSKAASQVKNLLRDAVPQYDQAVRLAGEPIRAREGIQLGRSILSPKSSDEFMDDLSSLVQKDNAAGQLRQRRKPTPSAGASSPAAAPREGAAPIDRALLPAPAGATVPRNQALTVPGGRALSTDVRPPNAAQEEVVSAAVPIDTYVKQGVREAIDERIARVQTAFSDPSGSEAREAMKALKELSSRANRDKVRAVIGDAQSSKLFRELDQAAVSFELKAAVAENSKTYARTALADRIGTRADEGAVNALRRGRPLEAVGEAASRVLGGSGRAAGERKDAIYSDLVKSLTGPANLNRMEALAEARAPLAVGDAVDRAATRAGGRAPLAGVGPGLGPPPDEILAEYPDARQGPDGSWLVWRNGRWNRVVQ